jgi:hypothetical protein
VGHVLVIAIQQNLGYAGAPEWGVQNHMSTIDTLVSVCQQVTESASRSLATQLFSLFFEDGVGEQEAVSKWFIAPTGIPQFLPARSLVK